MAGNIDNTVNVKFIADMENLQSSLTTVQQDMGDWKKSTEGIFDSLKSSMDGFGAEMERGML